MSALERIKIIELELHNQCNRSCAFCLLHYYPTESRVDLKLASLYKLFKELSEADYGKRGGLIVFSGFYEPFLDDKILRTVILMLRDTVPDVRIKINTNGDYLSKRNIGLLDLVHEINMMDYDSCNKQPSWFAMNLRLARIKATNLFDYYISEGDSILKYKKNTLSNLLMEDRGGTLPEQVEVNGKILNWYKNHEIRKEPCLEGWVSLAIGSDGNVYPCCHVRGHVPQHKVFILGNINKSSLEEILEGEKYSDFMNCMRSKDYKKYPEACRRCQKRVKLADKYGG